MTADKTPEPWKTAAAAIKRDHPQIGRKLLFDQLRARGYTMGVTSVQRLLDRWKREGVTAAPPGPEQEQQRLIEDLRRDLNEARDQLHQARTIHGLLDKLDQSRVSPPAWTRQKPRGKNRAIMTAPLTDTHFDEVVDPEQIEYLNCYNREIALLRLRKWANNVVNLGSSYLHNITIEGTIVPLLGDILSGDIHDELSNTNESTVIDSALYWSEHLAAAIELIAKTYGRVYVPCVVGNHGRRTRKPAHKNRVKDNMDYLVYSLLARHYHGSEQITIDVSPSADIDYPVYGTVYRATHGDQFKGGSGIAAALSPMMLGDSRKRKKASIARRPYDYLMMGHWHVNHDFKGIIACPSLKGYDEYAHHSNFEPSPPGGYLWLDDPQKGRTIRAPVHVLDKAEDWGIDKKNYPTWMAA